MSRAVIVHRWEESASGSNRIVESGAFDPDADDNPDWVKKALADRKEAEEETPRLTEWEGDQTDEAQPAAVLDPLGFGEDTSKPEGVGEEPEVDEDPLVDEDPQPATVIGSVPFGEDSGEDEKPKAEQKAEPKKAQPKPKAHSTDE